MLQLLAIFLALAVPLPVHSQIQAQPYREITADVTAYTSDPAETWGDGTITASGVHVHPGTLACPRDIEFGTQVIIAGQTYTCEDRMNPRFGKRFDIWMASKADAFAWGIQNTDVKIALSTQ